MEMHSVVEDGYQLDVILINWNSTGDTLRLLQQIHTWERISALVHVVDNASARRPVEIADNYPDVHLIFNEENSGFAGGNNAVFTRLLHANADERYRRPSHVFLLLNNDADIDEKNLLLLLEYLERHDDVALIGPVLYAPGSGRVLNAGGLDPARHVTTYLQGPEAERLLARRKRPYGVDYVSGTVALVRTSVLRTVGFFDEKYFFSCEVADLCERAKGLGYRCMVHPGARAYHDMSSKEKKRSTLYIYYSLRNRFLFIRKHRQHMLYRLFWFWAMVAVRGIVSNMVSRRPATSRAMALALRDGIAGRYGGKNHLFL